MARARASTADINILLYDLRAELIEFPALRVRTERHHEGDAGFFFCFIDVSCLLADAKHSL